MAMETTVPKSLRISWVAGLILLLGVITLVMGRAEEQKFIDLFRRSAPQWLVAAALLQSLTYVCAAASWQQSLRRLGQFRSLSSLIPLGLAKLFTDQAVPSAGLSGTILLIHSLERRHISREGALGTVLIELVAYYASYILCVAAALLVLWLHGDLSRSLLIPATALTLLALGVPWLLFWLRRHPGFFLTDRLRHLPWFKPSLETLEAVPAAVLRSPTLMARVIALHAMIFVLDALTLLVMLRAVGTHLPFAQVFACFIMASVVATLLIMPGGLGTFEGTCVAMLHVFGVPLEVGLAATLLLRGFTFWLPMLPGLWLARREMI